MKKSVDKNKVLTPTRPASPAGVHFDMKEPVKNLATPVDIPNIPIYSGQSRYVTGKVQQNGTTTTTSLFYELQDKYQDAASWYENALKMYNWTVIAQGPTNICAKDSKGNILNVSFSGLPKTAKYRTTLSITYVERKQ